VCLLITVFVTNRYMLAIIRNIMSQRWQLKSCKRQVIPSNRTEDSTFSTRSCLFFKASNRKLLHHIPSASRKYRQDASIINSKVGNFIHFYSAKPSSLDSLYVTEYVWRLLSSTLRCCKVLDIYEWFWGIFWIHFQGRRDPSVLKTEASGSSEMLIII
jgi:hypothetical protein